jgi:hypothetical protein
LNVWKPIALITTAACIFVLGQPNANAGSDSTTTPPTIIAQGQPHMQAALAALKTARVELDKAEHDKGGWRTAATRETATAITETERGIHFDASH